MPGPEAEKKVSELEHLVERHKAIGAATLGSVSTIPDSKAPVEGADGGSLVPSHPPDGSKRDG